MAVKTKFPGVKRLDDGRYRVRVTATDPRPGASRIQREETLPHGASASDAVRRREEVREEIQREIQARKMGKPRLAEIATVGDYAVYWMERKVDDLSYKAAKQYTRALEEHTLPYMQDVPARDVVRADVTALVGAMDREVKDDGTPYSRATRRSWWRVARQMLEDMAAELQIPNPTRRVKSPKVDGGNHRTDRTLTLPQLVDLYHKARMLGDQRTLEVLILATTGMRVGEMYGLKWSDIDYEAGQIHVRRTATEARIRPYTKTGSGRVCPLAPMVARRMREQHKRLVRRGHLEHNLVCPSTKGGARYAASLYKALDTLSDAMGLDFRIRPQVIRRTVNTLVLDSGGSEIVLRSIMGHADRQMSELYAGVEIDQKRALLTRALGPLFEEDV